MYIYQDLPRQYLDNIGGTLAKIQLLSANASPAGDFEHLSYPEDYLLVTDDSFIALNDFKTFGLIMDTTSYESGIVDVDGDQVTETVFKGKMPRVTLAGIQVCSSFVKSRCLAIVTDRNGLRRILGRKEAPAVFKFKEVTGERFESLNNIEIQISITHEFSPAFLP